MAHGGTQNAVASVPPSSEQRENTNSNSSGSGSGAGTPNNAISSANNTSSSNGNNSMNNFCSACGVQFESSASLQVHIQNHHHNQPVTAAADSSDNQPPTPQSTASASATSSSAPGNGAGSGGRSVQGATTPTNGDLATAPNQQQQQQLNSYNRVDYSANQLPNYHHHHLNSHQQHQQPPPPPSEMHYPSYMSNYDQYYHQHSMEYGLPPPPPIPTHYLNNLAAGDYKVVPSSNRFHPYGGISNNLAHPYGTHHQQNGSALATAAAISAAAAAQSSMSSPSIVTSSSPIQNNLMNSTTLVPSAIGGAQTPSAIAGQPTPSPSPRQCDKCGVVCETVTALNEHQVQAHNATPNEAVIGRSGDLENDIPSFHYSNFGHHHPHHTHGHHHHHHQQQQQQQKDEQSQHQPPDCDILDLDSQKMVYPPHEMQQQQQAPLPPMHSLHPMQRPMMWPPHGPPIPPPHDSNSFLPIPAQSDLKSSMFGSIKNEFSPQIIKQETGGNHMTQLPTTPTNPTQSDIAKSFGSAGSDGSQTSPSEFPSTTTPQDNGPQFRTFEAATSSLQNGGPIIKATSWKSNEARRPKTYNCTACNKWFTSSGHLKRHYNTTLHKNAVKTSGQPDPATLPISAHHHPARDPNSKHNRYNNNKTTHNNNSIVQHQSQAQIQSGGGVHQQHVPSESSRTPDFSSQFSPFATGNGGGGGGGGGGGPQTPQQQSANAASMGFQYTANANAAIHQSSNVSNHPLNAQAGLCGQASQPRDLLTYSDLTGAQQPLHSNNSSSSSSNSSSNQHHQLVPDFIQVPQMQQIIPAESIITTMQPPQSMVTSMSMDHHYNITTPITINTSITQSYPLMLRPAVVAVAEDTSYTIGNANHSLHHHPQLHHSVTMMHHTGNSDDSNGTAFYAHSNDYDESVTYDSGYPQLSSNCSTMSNGSCISAMSSDDDKLTKYSATTIPTIAALRRLNHDIHHADTVPPFSPDIPDKRCGSQTAMHQSYGMTRSQTPQTGETVPTNLSPNAPHSQQQQQHHHHHHHHQHQQHNQHHFITVDGITIKNETPEDIISLDEPSSPNSPSITSTNTSIGYESHYAQNQQQQQQNQQQQNGSKTTTTTKKGGKPTKRRTAAETAKLITDTIPPGSDPLRCEPCDKVFNKSCYLTQHNKTFHSGDKPFKCQRCGKRFPCDQSHTKHMAKHVTSNKPFKCSQCVKQFNHKTDLRRHMCLHTGTKPYVCETCNKGFIRKDHMVKHKLTHTKRKNGDINNAPPTAANSKRDREMDDENEYDDPAMMKHVGEFENAAKRRKSVLVKNDMYQSPTSPPLSPPTQPAASKYYRSHFNSIKEMLKQKPITHLDDHDTDQSIENKENVNTDVITIE